jgi:membrane protein YdbS with pleckstrin-like domain
LDQVTDDVAPPASPSPSTGPGRLEPVPGEWRRVSPAYVWVDLVGVIIRGIVFAAAVSIPFWVSWEPWMLVFPAVVIVVSVVYAAFTPRRVRSIGYLLRDDDLLFRRGLMWQRFVAVPYGRMQLVDVNRGPLDRALGLAGLRLVTAAAASNVVVPGLPLADAEGLRDHLVELAETRRAGL